MVELERRVKLTLSIREDLVRKVKSRLALEDKGLSEIVEESLENYYTENFFDDIISELGFEKVFYSSEEVKKNRPKGIKAEEIIREVRDERGEHIS